MKGPRVGFDFAAGPDQEARAEFWRKQAKGRSGANPQDPLGYRMGGSLPPVDVFEARRLRGLHGASPYPHPQGLNRP